MSDPNLEAASKSGLPMELAEAVASVPKAWIPASIKAMDRLIGAAVDIPVAKMAQVKARIDAQTEAYKAVEAAIAKVAATEAAGNPEHIERAMETLVRKEYRKQKNTEAVARAMLEDLTDPEKIAESKPEAGGRAPSLDDDWLNVFERYAEDATSERMQRLWGRVIAGEVRAPGKYSMRTLRFLSEFSQADALAFGSFSASSFGDQCPTSLCKVGVKDLRDLIYLESAGLIQGASGLGLTLGLTFNSQGAAFLREGSLAIMLKGTPGAKIELDVVAVTPLGQELVTLLPGRDARSAARVVAKAIRRPEIVEAYMVNVAPTGEVMLMEILWSPPAPTVTQTAPMM